jgi:hypothetical protein
MIWICECKYWEASIPKEKVLTLYEVIKDLGADRGFLFSESGFQSGAIRCSKNTNITLTSLDEIQELIQSDLQEYRLINFLKRIENLRKKLKISWIDDLGNPILNYANDIDKCLLIEGTLMYATLQIQKAINKDFPIYLTRYSMENIQCKDIEELNTVLNQELEILEPSVEEINIHTKEKVVESKDLVDLFAKSINGLLKSAENQLFDLNVNIDEQLIETLSFMKAVGKTADDLKKISTGTLASEVYKIMRLLLEFIYPHLTKIEMNRNEWNDSKNLIITQLNVLTKI